MRICTKCNAEKPLSEFYENKIYTDGYSTNCKQCIRDKRKSYRGNNKEKIQEYKKKNNKGRVLLSEEDKKKRKKERRKQYRSRRSELQKERLNTDSLFKLKRNLRNRVWALMKGSKSKSTQELLGIDYETVKQHIEDTFQKGMSWQNYGQWHVDHKIPLASANNKKELEELFHYTNLQALWASDNSSKKDKII